MPAKAKPKKTTEAVSLPVNNEWTPRRWSKEVLSAIPWNQYQMNVFEALEESDENLVISATAGSGKSTLLKGIIGLLPPDAKINVMMYNVSIKEAFEKDPRVPKRVTVSTAHGCGYGLLIGYFRGNAPDVDDNKAQKLSEWGVKRLRETMADKSRYHPIAPPKLPDDPEVADIMLEKWQEGLRQLIDFARLNLAEADVDSLEYIASYFAIRFPFGKLGLAWGIKFAIDLLDDCYRMGVYDRVIDYADMVWLPHKLKLYPRKPKAAKAYLLVDECVTGDTLVTLADGTKRRIDTIVNNQLELEVLSFNEITQQIEAKKITGWHKVPVRKRKIVNVHGLKATTDHPIYTKEQGYVYAGNLNNNHSLLEINDEKLQSFRSANSDRAFNYHRIATWRRFDQQTEMERQAWECQSLFYTRDCPRTISCVETRTVNSVGETRPVSSSSNRIWRSSEKICNPKPSIVYSNFSDDATKWWQKTDYPGSTQSPNTSGIGSVVHGRRFFQWFMQNIYLQFFGRRHSASSQSFDFYGMPLQASTDKKRNNIGFFGKWSIQFLQSDSAIHSPDSSIQTATWQHSISSKTETAGNQNRKTLSCLPNPSCGIFRFDYTNIFSPLLWSAMSECQSKNQQSFENLPMPYLFNSIPDSTEPQYGRCLVQDVQQTMRLSVPKIEKAEWVYCIDVEDNHNFFGNGILSHNCQDANRAFISLYKKFEIVGYRCIFVGDPYQGVSGYMGALPSAIDTIIRLFNARVLPLSESQRCPKSHVALASLISPDMKARPDAIDGSCQLVHPEQVKKMVQPGNIVLCRFVAPLIKLLLEAKFFEGKQGVVRARDIAKEMSGFARQVGKNCKWHQFHSKLIEQKEYLIERHTVAGQLTQADAVSDRYQCLEYCYEFLGRNARSLKEFVEAIEAAFPKEDEDRSRHVIYSSIHSAKGDESESIYIVGTNLLPYYRLGMLNWQFQQEIYATFVALTRSKAKMYFVPMTKDPVELAELMTKPCGGLKMEYFEGYEGEE